MESNKKSRILKISILFIILILTITIISTVTINKIIAATEGEDSSIDKSFYTESPEMGDHRIDQEHGPNDIQNPSATGESERSDGKTTVTTEIENTYVDENGETQRYLTSDTLTYIDENGERKPAAPKLGDDTLFCIEPGGHVSTVNIRDGYMYEQWAADKEKWKNDIISYCRTGGEGCKAQSPKGSDNEHPYGFGPGRTTITTPVYYIRGNTVDLPPAMAYIISAGGGWSIDAQRGIWNLLGKNLDGGILIRRK